MLLLTFIRSEEMSIISGLPKVFLLEAALLTWEFWLPDGTELDPPNEFVVPLTWMNFLMSLALFGFLTSEE